MKRIFIVTMLIEAEEVFKDVHPSREQVLAWVSSVIEKGEIEKKTYRKNVCMNVKDMEIYVKEIR